MISRVREDRAKVRSTALIDWMVHWFMVDVCIITGHSAAFLELAVCILSFFLLIFSNFRSMTYNDLCYKFVLHKVRVSGRVSPPKSLPAADISLSQLLTLTSRFLTVDRTAMADLNSAAISRPYTIPVTPGMSLSPSLRHMERP